MTYLFSPSKNLFFLESMLNDYDAGYVPTDLREVENEVFEEYTKPSAIGKERGVGSDGMPCWIDIAPQTPDQLKEQLDFQILELKQRADSEISWRQDADDGGYATEKEKAELAEWKKYRVMLNRVDTSKAPEVTLPEQPK